MHTLLVTALVLSFWLIPANTPAGILEDDFSDKLYLIQKIHISEMGASDEADRFRFLLEEQLSKKGFTVVDKSENADAILTGALSVRVYDDASIARVYVQLKSSSGERLWGGNFGARRTLSRKESVQLRAEDVANRLRDDWKKSAKKAGVKVDK